MFIARNMSFKKSYQIIILLILGIFLHACGMEPGVDDADPNLLVQAHEENSETYQFGTKDCSTGRHSFSSSNSATARQKLCAALQNDALNHFCAQNERRIYSELQCNKQEENPKTNPAPVESPSTPRAGSKEALIHTALSKLLIGSYQLSPQLSPSQALFIKSYIEDMKICGLSRFGSNCLISSGLGVNDIFRSGGTIYEDNKETLFAVELDLINLNPNSNMPMNAIIPIWYVFKIDKNRDYYSSGQLRIFRKLKLSYGQPFNEYLNDTSSVQELASITLDSDIVNSAWKSVRNPSDIRTLFHMPTLIIETPQPMPFREQAANMLIEIIDKNQHLVANAKNRAYPEKILHMMETQLDAPSLLIKHICEKMLESLEQKNRILAASYLINFEPSRDDLKPLVRLALKDSSSNVRERAIWGFSKTHPSLEDQILLMAMIEDNDFSVRKTAKIVVSEFSFVARHAPALARFLESSDSETRQLGLNSLEKIPGREASAILIAHLNGIYSDVNLRSYALMQSRDVTEEMVPALALHFSSYSNSLKHNVLKLIARDSGPIATSALIDALDDYDSTIREAAYQQLNLRNLTVTMVPALIQKLESTTYFAKDDIINLLAKIPGSQVSLALIPYLDDERSNTRTLVKTHLQTREMTQIMKPALVTNLNSFRCEVKENTVDLLDKILDSETTLTLIPYLNDSCSSLRTKLYNILNYRELQPSMVPALVDLFNGIGYESENIIKLLGKIPTNEVTSILISHLDDAGSKLRETVIAELQTRSFIPSMVPALATHLGSSDREIRESVQIFLGRICGHEATFALIAHLDDVYDSTRNGLIQAIDQRVLDVSMVTSLARKFETANSQTRVSIAKFLGKIKNKDSLNALENRLKKEYNESVKEEIRQAIDSIRNNR